MIIFSLATKNMSSFKATNSNRGIVINTEFGPIVEINVVTVSQNFHGRLISVAFDFDSIFKQI